MRPNQKIQCPNCGNPMDPRASRGCYRCSRKPLSEEGVYARSIGISTRKLRALGGAAKLRGLSPDALAVLLAPGRYGYSQTVHNGGLKARGMHTRMRGVDTLIPPRVLMDEPFEMLVGEEDIQALSTESLGE